MTWRACWTVAAALGALSACEREVKSVAEPRAGAATKAEAHFAIENTEHEIALDRGQTLALRIVPRAGHKLNAEYPWRATIGAAPDGLVVASGAVEKGAMTLGPASAIVPIEVTAERAGDYAIEGSVDLSVCEDGDASRCLWYRGEPFTIEVRAKPAPAGAPRAPAPP